MRARTILTRLFLRLGAVRSPEIRSHCLEDYGLIHAILYGNGRTQSAKASCPRRLVFPLALVHFVVVAEKEPIVGGPSTTTAIGASLL